MATTDILIHDYARTGAQDCENVIDVGEVRSVIATRPNGQSPEMAVMYMLADEGETMCERIKAEHNVDDATAWACFRAWAQAWARRAVAHCETATIDDDDTTCTDCALSGCDGAGDDCPCNYECHGGESATDDKGE